MTFVGVSAWRAHYAAKVCGRCGHVTQVDEILLAHAATHRQAPKIICEECFRRPPWGHGSMPSRTPEPSPPAASRRGPRTPTP
jgi:hypothetical protein